MYRKPVKAKILIVDGHKSDRDLYAVALGQNFKCYFVDSIQDAWEILYEYPIQVIIADEVIEKTTGVDFLIQVQKQYPEVVRLMIADFENMQLCVLGNTAGIYQFLYKPWRPDNLRLIVGNAVKIFNLQDKNKIAPLEFKGNLSKRTTATIKPAKKQKDSCKKYAFDQLVRSEKSPLNGLCADIQKFSNYDIPVLIYGESGTGKELFARAIHHYSARASKPLIIENCAALPDDLLESELFGHVKGAFTGAYNDKTGLLERANGGTVFLDEIGDISPAFQVKLLRALQEKTIRKLGGNRYISIDIRVISATNKNLKEEIKANNFREDLFYRLAGMEFKIPPLRERKEDILPICMNIIKQGNLLFDKHISEVDNNAKKALERYPWPGNVRELQNEIQRTMVLSESDIITYVSLSAKLKEKK
ncbi:hypothetical protein [uncultured Gammaproteobacteria bacterium]|uniref:Response regulator of zinc sigma-54-dependent two-component system n=2 Tax=Bathymodiolus azoricus thioautotrophic gill symbiont TaxID=235205 RepID=A0ACA8ZTI2_9GAMM|nr:sigma-54 dependent transcriptional regulator [Bathymodiolus azoricus thioautotrophic gill symbiont]CAC9496342.1 hypothetical protein [uncultured Gammaproteobacteria bacterium]CAB5507567.1 Response regulator of zinc sigma-54-dependent two-component system [Bathymodiolus azoricus thioautotrophic gill symbiont]CAC9514583.1 hypothetical protein [uncultured Gammaproteobacteria bacterium]CAC9540699.1 hypothetical protein [uncultured Gammaproteobacteria bacterium]CAC9990465.1 hypothetical protein 